jgi:putative acyl-CoA dehydrogenase
MSATDTPSVAAPGAAPTEPAPQRPSTATPRPSTATQGPSTAPQRPSPTTPRPTAAPQDPARTVLNQPPPLEPVNLFDVDLALREALEREGGGWGVDRVREAAAVAGSAVTREHSRRAERNLPILRTHDRFGDRIDQVELDPSWHWLLRGAIEREIHSLPWREARPGVQAVRAALFMLWGNANDGVMCPVSMTYAVIPALRDGAPELAAKWEPQLTSSDYDNGALAGMAMTERQGGSDVRANITRADPLGDGVYEIHGHKWFCSYPPCDVFLVLAQAPGGLSCFLVERGPGMEFQRLKDKLGTRSLPSSEVEFRGIAGRLVGEEGRGVPAIIRMVNHTRLDCLLGATTGLRRGTLEAIHHARHRRAFGALLVDQPAMQNVLADLAVESEAATVAAMRVARSYDPPTPTEAEDEAAFRRFATAVMKYWVSKRAPGHAAEALECLGGNGFVEDSGMPLLYRDAPLNSIWEGSGNVSALDVLRATIKEPEGLPAFLAECELARGADRRLDDHLDRLGPQAEAAFTSEQPQFHARRLVEDLALALQGSLLARHAPPEVADAFCASRLAGQGGRVYGTLPEGVQAQAIIDRAVPA